MPRTRHWAQAINKIAGYHRNQIVLQSPRADLLQKVLLLLRDEGHLATSDRIAVDVDPVSLLFEFIPLLVLFEASIWMAKVMEPRWRSSPSLFDDRELFGGGDVPS